MFRCLRRASIIIISTFTMMGPQAGTRVLFVILLHSPNEGLLRLAQLPFQLTFQLRVALVICLGLLMLLATNVSFHMTPRCHLAVAVKAWPPPINLKYPLGNV